MTHSMKNQYKMPPGTVVEGKWHHNRYTIIKELGNGANGIVYLAKKGNQKTALKMSDNGMTITSEVNVLKSFEKVQASALGPSLLDVDDWVRKSGNVSFYAMEYIQGPDFMTFLEQKGSPWLPVLLLQLLADLEKLHRNGWIFGDLKPENLIVTGPPVQIRCIDVGGTTMKGRAIKEFTEFFDRGYWGLGSRKADPGYDLFAVAMITINTAYPNRFSKNTGGIAQLSSMIKQKKSLQKLESVILHALQGDYQSADEMRNDLIKAINKEKDIHRTSGQTRSTVKSKSVINPKHQKKGKKGGLMETFVIFMMIFFLYVIYIYVQFV
jgi:serine/threonine protein kinase